jgi:hypothetical protein
MDRDTYIDGIVHMGQQASTALYIAFTSNAIDEVQYAEQLCELINTVAHAAAAHEGD